MNNNKVVLYVHGKGGSAAEAEFYPNRRKTPSFSYGDIRRVSFAGSMPVKDTIQRR